MSIRHTAVRLCEHPGCDKWDRNDNTVVHHHITGDFCVCHYPLPRCGQCNRRMRPYKATIEMWPGTVGKASTSPLQCSGCRQAGRNVLIKRRKTWTCHCGATTQAGNGTWWRTKYFGALCPQHRHPLCAGCFKPMRNTTELPDGITRRYSTNGRCTSCAGGRVKSGIDLLSVDAIESVRRITPPDLWWYLGLEEVQ